MPLSMGTQWVTIANRALARLGTYSITSLTDGSNQAFYCNSLLPEAVMSVYAEYDWPSAKKRIQLSYISEEPLYDWSYAYLLPNDFVRLISVSSDQEYSIEGRYILSNDDSMYVTYIGYPAEAVNIPGYLANAITTNLAFLLSTPLSASESLANRLLAEYQLALQRAKSLSTASNYQEPDATWYDEVR